jgi:hypothetical protein
MPSQAKPSQAKQAKQAGLLGFNDGKWQGQLASFGLADRAWAESIHDRKPKLALDAGLK